MTKADTGAFRVTRLEDTSAGPTLGGSMFTPVWTTPAKTTPESRQQGLLFLQAASPSITLAAEKLGISREMAAAIGDGYAIIEPFDEAIAVLKG